MMLARQPAPNFCDSLSRALFNTLLYAFVCLFAKRVDLTVRVLITKANNNKEDRKKLWEVIDVSMT